MTNTLTTHKGKELKKHGNGLKRDLKLGNRTPNNYAMNTECYTILTQIHNNKRH